VALGFAEDWKLYAVALFVAGLGFYMLHNTFQALVTEVAPGARASAVALHAFSFFCGQAIGVVLIGFGLRSIGFAGSTAIAALLILGVASFVLTRPAAQRAR
jgi:predicted MFS family arabinose efflux permease